MGEHVQDGVGLAFDPEFVAELGVGCYVEGSGFAGVGDYGVVVWISGWTVAILEFAGEEIWERSAFMCWWKV